MYFKIVKGSTIVDAMETLSYVRQNPKNAKIIASQTEYANGILSSDGTVVWHLEGLPEFRSGNFETVVAIEVCKEEYDSIVETLQLGETVENQETPRPILTSQEMMEKIDALTKEVSDLKAELAKKS